MAKGHAASPQVSRNARRRRALVSLAPAVVAGFAATRLMSPAMVDSGSATPEDARAHRAAAQRREREMLQPWAKEVRKQLEQAANFFADSIRVPAILLAAQASSDAANILELPSNAHQRYRNPSDMSHAVNSKRSKRYIALCKVHLILTVFTMCLNLTVVLLCSTAHAQLLDVNMDDLALEQSAMDLILRHVEFEYVASQLAFFSGILTFLMAITARMAASLGAGPHQSTVTRQRELLLCFSVVCMCVSTLAWWADIWCEDLPEVMYLFRRFTWLTWLRLSRSPSALLTVLLSLCAVTLTTGSFIFEGGHEGVSLRKFLGFAFDPEPFSPFQPSVSV
mmetsp:Transcript_33087/g.72058  ORF Transcript_33087/g.72058 Transcript_33087/m.72058 type:complete len:337 (+) Transcript_33087:61-1071(+)